MAVFEQVLQLVGLVSAVLTPLVAGFSAYCGNRAARAQPRYLSHQPFSDPHAIRWHQSHLMLQIGHAAPWHAKALASSIAAAIFGSLALFSLI